MSNNENETVRETLERVMREKGYLNDNNQINNQTSIPWNSHNIDNTAVPRIWETAADGKRVYDNVVRQEGDFIPQDQNMFSYDWSVFNAVSNMLSNYLDLHNVKLSDKYKHAYMNCEAAQYGKGGSDIATIISNLREWNDKRTGANTLDSSNGDQYANRIGRLLGGKYPEEDCDELVQRYIKKRY